MEHCFRLPDTIESILAEITFDLAECIESTWAVAFAGPYSKPWPLYTFGLPDVERCLARIPLAHAGQLGSSVQCSGCGLPHIVCPVQVHGETVAALVFGPKQCGENYAPRDCQLIKRSAAHLAFILGDEHLAAKVGRRMARHLQTKSDLALARQVQDRLFTYPLPPFPGLDYHGECWPVGELGGDFFDFAACDNSALSITIGDVSGKGAPAAITMAAALGSLKALGPGCEAKFSDVVGRLNDLIWQLSPESVFASMFHARFDASRQELQYVNAGHGGVYLFRDDLKRTMRLESTGRVLGLSTPADYQQRCVRFAPGDTLVAVTDGISEASDANGRIIDEALLLDAVRNSPSTSSSDIAANIIHAVDTYLNGAEPHDDRTVIAVQFKLMAGASEPRSLPVGLDALAQAG
jgi:sigma-B regulation protein RsbU (phosphoserine phosphatase)